ncbi:MAG: hypothetical protein K8S99_14415 [Planctomycetes bacterium]|nr:hypothetical protein [Planctomycetota bacterium]
MYAAFAKANITPPIGCRMVGYATRDAAGPAKTIHDDLFVSALWMDHGGEKALILAYDLCLFDRAAVAEFKARVQKELGLQPRQVLMNTSHTHSGPNTCRWTVGAFIHPPDPAYMAKVLDATIDAARRARDAAKPVLMYAGWTTTKLPVSRRKIDAQGKAQWAPAPDVPVLNSAPFLLMRESPNADGKPICLLYSVSCHPSTINGHAISADYPGVANRVLDEALGASCAMFLQGCAGDTKASVIADADGGASWRYGDWEDVERAGRMVADNVLAAMKQGTTQVAPSVAAAIEDVQLPLAQPPSRAELAAIASKREHPSMHLWAQSQVDLLDKGQPLATHAPVVVQAIRISKGVRIIAIEGEPVAGIGRRVEQQFQQGITFPLGYSNGQGLYIPTEAMLPEGGYEVESAWEYGFPAPLAVGFESALFTAIDRFKAVGVV